jgi:hypothetical protein
MHSGSGCGSGSGTGFRSGCNVKWNKKKSKKIERPTFCKTLLLLTLKRQYFVQFLLKAFAKYYLDQELKLFRSRNQNCNKQISFLWRFQEEKQY